MKNQKTKNKKKNSSYYWENKNTSSSLNDRFTPRCYVRTFPFTRKPMESFLVRKIYRHTLQSESKIVVSLSTTENDQGQVTSLAYRVWHLCIDSHLKQFYLVNLVNWIDLNDMTQISSERRSYTSKFTNPIFLSRYGCKVMVFVERLISILAPLQSYPVLIIGCDMASKLNALLRTYQQALLHRGLSLSEVCFFQWLSSRSICLREMYERNHSGHLFEDEEMLQKRAIQVLEPQDFTLIWAVSYLLGLNRKLFPLPQHST